MCYASYMQSYPSKCLFLKWMCGNKKFSLCYSSKFFLTMKFSTLKLVFTIFIISIVVSYNLNIHQNLLNHLFNEN